MIPVTAKTEVIGHHPIMAFGFHVVRKLDNGELLPVTWRADLDAAETLLRALAEYWPGEYWIEEASTQAAPCAPFIFPASGIAN